MTDTKISDLTALAGASIASTDELVIVDKSDTTMASSGTDKKTTATDIATAVGSLLSLASTYQPLDSDLTAIAALTTTSFGRSLLALADAAALRSSAGVVIGTDVEAHDADLTTIAGLSPSNDDILQRKAGAWTNRTVAQLASDLGLAASYQPLDSDLTAIAALVTTSYGRGLLTLASATALAAEIPSSTITNAQLATEAQSTIKGRAAAAGTGAVTDLTATQVRTIIDTNTTPSTQAVADAAAVGTADTLARGDHKHAWPSAASFRTALSLVVGTNVQAWDADLDALAAISPSQGDIIYHNGTSWVRLAAGTSGNFLKTQGAGANPTWAAASGSGGATTARRSGQYYELRSLMTGVVARTTAQDSSSGRMWLVHHPYIGPSVNLEAVGIEVSGADSAGAKLRVGVYAAVGGVVATDDGLFGANLYDSGQLAADTTGFKGGTGLSIAIPAEGLWLAFVGQSLTSGPTIRAMDYNSPFGGPAYVNSSTDVRGGAFAITGVTAAMPGSITGSATALGGIGWVVPDFMVRYA